LKKLINHLWQPPESEARQMNFVEFGTGKRAKIWEKVDRKVPLPYDRNLVEADVS